MTISKGWVFMLGVLAGIIIGLSDAGLTFWAWVITSVISLARTAGL